MSFIQLFKIAYLRDSHVQLLGVLGALIDEIIEVIYSIVRNLYFELLILIVNRDQNSIKILDHFLKVILKSCSVFDGINSKGFISNNTRLIELLSNGRFFC